MNQILMTVREASERYSISRSKVYDIMKRSDAPQPVKFGKKNMLVIDEFDDFIFSTYANREMNERPRRNKNFLNNM